MCVRYAFTKKNKGERKTDFSPAAAEGNDWNMSGCLGSGLSLGSAMSGWREKRKD
jgi:hypothetical protein